MDCVRKKAQSIFREEKEITNRRSSWRAKTGNFENDFVNIARPAHVAIEQLFLFSKLALGEEAIPFEKIDLKSLLVFFVSENLYVWQKSQANVQLQILDMPIMMLTARKSDIDKIKGLGFGADDYIEKTFLPSVLVARVKSQLAQFSFLDKVNIKVSMVNSF